MALYAGIKPQGQHSHCAPITQECRWDGRKMCKETKRTRREGHAGWVVGPQGVRDPLRLQYNRRRRADTLAADQMDIAAPAAQPAKSVVYADLE